MNEKDMNYFLVLISLSLSIEEKRKIMRFERGLKWQRMKTRGHINREGRNYKEILQNLNKMNEKKMNNFFKENEETTKKKKNGMRENKKLKNAIRNKMWWMRKMMKKERKEKERKKKRKKNANRIEKWRVKAERNQDKNPRKIEWRFG